MTWKSPEKRFCEVEGHSNFIPKDKTIVSTLKKKNRQQLSQKKVSLDSFSRPVKGFSHPLLSH